MLCLSGFELYSRWVPLRTFYIVNSQDELYAKKKKHSKVQQNLVLALIPYN